MKHPNHFQHPVPCCPIVIHASNCSVVGDEGLYFSVAAAPLRKWGLVREKRSRFISVRTHYSSQQKVIFQEAATAWCCTLHPLWYTPAAVCHHVHCVEDVCGSQGRPQEPRAAALGSLTPIWGRGGGGPLRGSAWHCTLHPLWHTPAAVCYHVHCVEGVCGSQGRPQGPK